MPPSRPAKRSCGVPFGQVARAGWRVPSRTGCPSAADGDHGASFMHDPAVRMVSSARKVAVSLVRSYQYLVDYKSKVENKSLLG
jgi:hypothetical protein